MAEHVGLSVDLAGHIANVHHRMDLAIRRSGANMPDVDDSDDDEIALLRGNITVNDFLATNPTIASHHDHRATRGSERRALQVDVETFVCSHERLLTSLQTAAVFDGIAASPGASLLASRSGTPRASVHQASGAASRTESPSPSYVSAAASEAGGTTGAAATKPATRTSGGRNVDPVEATLHQLRGVGLIVHYDADDNGEQAGPAHMEKRGVAADGAGMPVNASSAPGNRKRAATFSTGTRSPHVTHGGVDAGKPKDFYARCYSMRLAHDDTVIELHEARRTPEATAHDASTIAVFSFALADLESVSTGFRPKVNLTTAVGVRVTLRGLAASKRYAVFVFPSSVSHESWMAAMGRLARRMRAV
jgi:hypothetical protein